MRMNGGAGSHQAASGPSSPSSPNGNGYNAATAMTRSLPRETERDKAKREAQQCLQAMREEGFQLDGFNLLGVVANPNKGMSSISRHNHNHNHNHNSSSNSTHHHQSNGSNSKHNSSAIAIAEASTTDAAAFASSAANPQTPLSSSSEAATAAAAVATTVPESDMFADAVHSLESTLGQVAEQIEVLNLFVGELSRQYLGDDGAGESLFLEYYYQNDEDDGEGLVPAPPPELSNLQLMDLQAYLEQCGVLAHSLFSQGLQTSSLPPVTQSAEDAAKASLTTTSKLPEIPSLFSDPDFDLTQSETFVQLLLQDAVGTNNNSNGAAISSSSTAIGSSLPTEKMKSRSLYQSTAELVPIREPDVLVGHLDRVELALQEQVRLKAGAFFQETTRFRQLGTAIDDLLAQIQTLRRDVNCILSVYRQTTTISNHARHQYETLQEVVDAAINLLQTKASIGGLLSANDHLGVAQQIQYGRRLLQGLQSNGNGNGEDPMVNGDHVQESTRTSSSVTLELQKLTALSSCTEQFQQYESLVVQSLSEELVDAFFHWRGSSITTSGTAADTERRVHEMVEALQLCRALHKAGELYQRRLQQTIRMTVRTTIAEFVESTSSGGGGGGVTGMTYPDFCQCLEDLMEELQSVLKVARMVDEFCATEAIFPVSATTTTTQSNASTTTSASTTTTTRWTHTAMVTGADLAAKSIAELLRLRKEAHSLISLNEMRQLWDTCLNFTLTVEGYYENQTKAVALRSTLLGQAKAFLDRTHESNMSALAAALDSERWTPCEVSPERQAVLTRLCTGRAMMATPLRRSQDGSSSDLMHIEKRPMALVEGVEYKVVWSCLLLVEMIMTNLTAAVHFQSLATNAVTKVADLLRLFNTRSTQLVLGAGAIKSAARLKSINAKHLSLVTQCLGMTTALLPHIRAALMNQLPARQHTLLEVLDRIRRDYTDHSEMVLNKFVTIIGGIVEHGLAPRIANTDFDARANDLSVVNVEEIACCVFLDGVSTTTHKMHQVLNAMLPPDHLQDVFSRIFAYVDQKVPTLLIAATVSGPNGSASFQLPANDDGKRRLILEVEAMTVKLNNLACVVPWDFNCMTVLERKMDYTMQRPVADPPPAEEQNSEVEANDEDEIPLPEGESTSETSPVPLQSDSVAEENQVEANDEHEIPLPEGESTSETSPVPLQSNTFAEENQSTD